MTERQTYIIFLSLLDTYEKVKLTKCFKTPKNTTHFKLISNSFQTHFKLHHTFGGTSFAFLGPRGSPLAVKNGLILWIRLNLICSTTRKNYNIDSTGVGHNDRKTNLYNFPLTFGHI